MASGPATALPWDPGPAWVGRWGLQRGVALTNLLAVLVALRQFRPLAGETGPSPWHATATGPRSATDPACATRCPTTGRSRGGRDGHRPRRPRPARPPGRPTTSPPAVNGPGVVVYRVTELALPFLSVAPKPIEAVAGLLTVAFYGWLLPTGKVSWLNWLTVVLAVSTFEDAVVAAVLSLLAGLLDGDDGLRSPPDRPVRQRTAAIRSDAP